MRAAAGDERKLGEWRQAFPRPLAVILAYRRACNSLRLAGVQAGGGCRNRPLPRVPAAASCTFGGERRKCGKLNCFDHLGHP